MTHDSPSERSACRLTVTLRDSRGALARIASALSCVPVNALTYAVVESTVATAEIVVSSKDAARAYARLNRMVDVVEVTKTPTLRTPPSPYC
jgi:acetolactate synthase small subunit